MSHSAALLPQKHANTEVGLVKTPKPGPGEILVKVKVIAFSPIEAKLQKVEVYPLSYPNILGLSFAGAVESVGPDVLSFSIGDRVAALRDNTQLNDNRLGAFQQYAIAGVNATSKLEAEAPLESAAAVIGNLATIAVALSACLGLDRPHFGKAAKPQGKRILVYGGSSPSGGLATCYATAAGYDVVTTSSPRNYAFVRSLGPSAIIDHTKPADEINENLKANGPYHKVLDAIGLPPVTKIIQEYISSAGGGSYHSLIPVMVDAKELPANVECKFESYPQLLLDPKHADLREWFYGELMTKGLTSGTIVSTPVEWVQGGLGQVQRALDLMHEGKVSGCKLVMDPWP